MLHYGPLREDFSFEHLHHARADLAPRLDPADVPQHGTVLLESDSLGVEDVVRHLEEHEFVLLESGLLLDRKLSGLYVLAPPDHFRGAEQKRQQVEVVQ